MPRIADILGQVKYISTLDLAKGYWQVPVVEEDRHKTAFVTTKGLYQFKMMPFGLWSTCSFLENDGSSNKRNESFCQCLPGQLHCVYCNLGRPSDWFESCEMGLITKPSKCQLAMAKCSYLRYVVGNGVVKPEIGKLKAVEHFPLPETKAQVQSFLGLTGYYCCLISNYITIAGQWQIWRGSVSLKGSSGLWRVIELLASIVVVSCVAYCWLL